MVAHSHAIDPYSLGCSTASHLSCHLFTRQTRQVGGGGEGGEFVSSNATGLDGHHQLVSTTAAVNTDNNEEQEQLFDEQSDDPQEFFFTLLLDFQSRRMDEQRCLLQSNSTSRLVAPDITTNNNNHNISTEPQTDNARRWELPPSSAGDQMEATAASVATREAEEEEAFFDLIAGFQGDRMNDQRASLPAFPGLRLGHDAEVNPRSFTTGTLSSIGSGESDGLPEVGRVGPLSLDLGRHHRRRRSCGAGAVGDVSPLAQQQTREQHPHRQSQLSSDSPNVDLLEMILRLQTRTRINDQRSSLPDPLHRLLASPPSHRRTSPSPSCTDLATAADGELQTRLALRRRPASIVVSSLSSPTVPDEDFFALIQRIQSARLDEQRCNPPESSSSTTREPGNAQGMANSAGPSISSSTTTVATSDANSSNRKPSSSTSGRRRSSWRRFNPSSSSSGPGTQSK